MIIPLEQIKSARAKKNPAHKAAAASGQLRPGDALPSIRPLAEELRLNRSTVAKAYAELESQRVIELAP